METERDIITDSVFGVSQMEVNYNQENLDHADEYTITESGWYWWDGGPIGPFATQAEAMADAREGN